MSPEWEADRSQMDPAVADAVDVVCDSTGVPWRVYRSWASSATQDALYAQGRANGVVVDPSKVVTNAPGGESAHNYCLADGTPQSKAADVVLLLDGVLCWDESRPEYDALIAAVRASADLHSGADFPPSIIDIDHIEDVHWRAIEAALKAAGTWPMRFPPPPVLT
jgi:hypothetical protein